jgi:hypothetical protein
MSAELLGVEKAFPSVRSGNERIDASSNYYGAVRRRSTIETNVYPGNNNFSSETMGRRLKTALWTIDKHSQIYDFTASVSR